MKLKLTPTYKQDQAYSVLFGENTARFLLFGGGASGGKSWLMCEWMIVMCTAGYRDLRYVLARKEITKLKRTTLRTFFKVAKHHGLKSGVHYKYNSQQNIIFFPITGCEIMLIELIKKPSDPFFEDLGSLELTGAGIDEAGQIVFTAFDILKSRIGRQHNQKYSIPGKLMISCNPTKNWLYKIFYRPWKEGVLPKEYAFIQSLVGDNDFVDSDYINQLKSIKNRAHRERLLHGNWEYDDDPSRIFDYMDILDLFTSTGDSGEKYLSVDVARFGEDKTVICYWSGLQCKKIWLFDKSSIPFTVKKVKAICEKLQVRRSHVVVDEDGVGGGVVDGLPGCKGFVNNSKAIQPPEAEDNEDLRVNFANLKTQCYFEFARLTSEGRVGISGIDEDVKALVVEELEQIKEKDIDKDGKISLEGKDKIKENLGRSPDLADALAMRFVFELDKLPDLKPFFI